MNRINFLIFITLILLGVTGYTQELPPIVNYSPEVYLGGNQNWCFSQSEDKFIYVANNDGLLEFNGSKWHLYPSPNKTIIRSVCAINDRIYTGSYMDFGYWTRNKFGSLDYFELSSKLNNELVPDEQFWNIIPYNKWVIFQSLNRVYFYNSEDDTISFIDSENTINKIFKVGDELYFQELNEGLFTIENGAKKIVSNNVVFKENIVIDIFKTDLEVAFITQNNGFYFLKDNQPEKWNIPADDVLKNLSIYNSKQLKNGSIVLGSIANGILLISKEGKKIFHINQYNGLIDNTALSLFEDTEGNIWAGLDNGIGCINLPAPISNYIDHIGRLGTTYASVFFEGNLYLGTNQGLFYKPLDGKDDFILVKGTEGQVWTLKLIDDQLFCGHNKGTFLIKNGEANLFSDIMGTWDIKKLENIPNTLIQGNFSGLYLLKKDNGSWKLNNKIEGFDISSKHFEIIDDNKILVSHEYKGVYLLDINSDYSEVVNYKNLESINEGSNSSLVKFDGKIYYAMQDGIFYFNDATGNFEKNEYLSSVFMDDEYISGILVADGDRLWTFTKNYINYFSMEKLGDNFKTVKIPLPQTLRNEMNGYQNITRIGEQKYLIGTSNGYLLMDLRNIYQKNYSIHLNSILSGDRSDIKKQIDISSAGEFAATQNFIEFEYSIPEYDKYLVVEYQYNLNGRLANQWSDWSTDSSVSFENLPYGNYIFKVKAKVNKQEVDNIASYSFKINRPWYLSNLAFIIYFLLLVTILGLINSIYKNYYRNQRERLLEKTNREMKLNELEAQKEIIQLKNTSLKSDIESRNRELAISTMSMIKKNNALSNIKEELIKLNEVKTVEPVVKLINRTLNDTEDWEYFEEAFNHADKNFFKKVKELHPQLTPNDLRLCVYLRLNLSSKEIAPLLNISPRSVEIKRYRLRKKIELNREINLNDYFINM